MIVYSNFNVVVLGYYKWRVKFLVGISFSFDLYILHIDEVEISVFHFCSAIPSIRQCIIMLSVEVHTGMEKHY